MEYLNEIIKLASVKVGGIQALEEQLGLPKKTLSMVGKTRGLPDIAQAKLEDLMELPQGSLRNASAIITEKKPENVEYLKKKLHDLQRIAAMIILGSVISFVTPTPSEAAPLTQITDSTLYIMSNAIRKIMKKMARFFASFAGNNSTTAAQRFCYVS
jgi:hypothetical protein